MLKSRGFTLIEVLTTMVILAIIATISAPEFWRWRDRDAFRSEGQNLFDTILTIRNNAQTNKSCSNGNTSVRWRLLLDSNATPPVYNVRCYWDETNNVVEIPNVTMTNSEVELVDFNGGAAPTAMVGAGLPDNIRFNFFSGSAVGRLEYSDGAINREDSVQIVIGHDDTGYQHTICFNRVAGFPTFNKTGPSCQTY